MAASDFDITHPATLVEWDTPDDRSLRILLEERSGLGPLEEMPGIGIPARQVIVGPNDRLFELFWEIVVCFAVRGDPFPNESPSFRTIVERDPASPFMNWVRATSHAEPDYVAAMANGSREPSPLRHWSVSTSDHHIDIASPDAPRIRQLVPGASVS